MCSLTQGDTAIDCFEVSASEPFFSQGKAAPGSSVGPVCSSSASRGLIHHFPLFLCIFSLAVSHCLTDTSTRGAAAVPKAALDVLSCEVMRVLQLTDGCIVPISYQVPRKVRTCTETTAAQSRHLQAKCVSFFHVLLLARTCLAEFKPGVSRRPLPGHSGHDSSHVCRGVVEGREQAGKRSALPTSFSCRHSGGTPPTVASVCPQVEKVSLNPDKQHKTKAAPAKKKEPASGGSKEV